MRWIAIVLLLVGCAKTQTPPKVSVTFTDQREIFGVPFKWETTSQESNEWLGRRVDELGAQFAITMDPDCLWRQQDCEPGGSPAQTLQMEALAAQIKDETGGLFDIRHKGPRDFAGLSQGFFLETLAREAKHPWLGDFAGDIYVSGGFETKYPLVVTEPLEPGLAYAAIEMESGWAIASTGRGLGASISNPNSEGSWADEYQRVVLFAREDFNGARLDAWSTALMAGGEALMARLWGLESYRGQWGYFLFDEAGKVTCSANVECDLDGEKKRVKFTAVPKGS